MIKIRECIELNWLDHYNVLEKADKEYLYRFYNKVSNYKAVKLINKKESKYYVIIHPSSKEPNKLQMSYFDEKGPIRDVIRDNMMELLDIIKFNFNIVDEFMG